MKIPMWPFLFLGVCSFVIKAKEFNWREVTPEVNRSTAGKQKSSCKINKLNFVKGYTTRNKINSLPEYVYMDIEMFGNVRIDLDDLEATVTEKNGKKFRSWAFDFFYLDKEGRRSKESFENNKKDYSHVGIIFPATNKSQKIQLQYWGGPLYDTVWNINPERITIP